MLVEAIASGKPLPGPLHAELNITDRCNVACYFCNQQDVRTKEMLSYEHIVGVIDELAATGLRSVRFSGGGDPLFHPAFERLLPALASRGVCVDNVTTNAVGLTPSVAAHLVANECRSVIVSLNAVDPADYARMMQVKPALFDRVVENTRHLLQVRGDRSYPHVTLQFLIDRTNASRMVEMYELGRAAGADTVAIGLVLDIPLERIRQADLLSEDDAARYRDQVRGLLEADRDANVLQTAFALPAWDALATELRNELAPPPPPNLPSLRHSRKRTAPAFSAGTPRSFAETETSTRAA